LRKGKKQTIKDISLAELKSPEAKSVEVRPFLFRKGSPQILLDRPKGEGRRVIITTNRMNDDFTSHRQEDGLSVTVTGTVTDGKATVGGIEIRDGDKHTKYESIDKVPEEYRAKVKDLVDMSEKNTTKVETKSGSKSGKESKSSKKIIN